MADRIIVLNEGRIEQIGTPAEIYHSPASTFVAAFMGAPPMNLLTARLDKGAVKVNGGSALAEYGAGGDGAVTLGIRPEDVTLDPGGATSFQVNLIEELGAHRLLHGQLGDQAFTVHVSKDDPATTGPMQISLKPDAVRLFDPETGRAL